MVGFEDGQSGSLVSRNGITMETIGSQQLYTLLEESERSERSSNTKVRNGTGHFVSSYLDLAYKIAELQFRNRDFVFLFRGQSRDFKNRSGNTSLRPTILRSASGDEIRQRYELLGQAERALIDQYRFLGAERVKRQQLIRWAILQHYEVCPTPLLDVSQSIRIAASFASMTDSSEAYFFVLGVPNISGAITASAEAGLTVLRLASVCPPDAVRPHVQEGFLLSEYPELTSLEQKGHYENYEIDFGLRLVAKFRFDPQTFWQKNEGFPPVTRQALYPSAANDPLLELAETIKRSLPSS
jgi:hypothetical protein